MTGLELALSCLALNIYHEARGEPLEGQFAVAFVTINRTHTRGLKMCGVVFQPNQFSWANNALDANGKMLPEYLPKRDEHWKMAKRIAKIAMNKDAEDFTRGATHYYADYIPPPKTWDFTKLTLTGKFGVHIFYRVKERNK